MLRVVVTCVTGDLEAVARRGGSNDLKEKRGLPMAPTSSRTDRKRGPGSDLKHLEM